MLATLVIGLREGLEAALIVGIIAAFLRKNGKSLTAMWLGVGLAVALSIALGVGLNLVEQALPQAAQEGMEAVIGAIAIFFVTGMIVWMNTHARHLKRELEAGAAEAVSRASAYALASMAFLAVLREGFETSVFLLATFSAAQSAALAAAGAIVGLLLAVLIAWGIYIGGIKLNLSRFFRVTGAFLILVAAGLAITSLRAAHEAGWLNAGQQPTVDLSWLVAPGTIQSALITGVLGIPADPRLIEVIGWFAYLIPVGLLVYWPPSRRPQPQAAARLRLSIAVALAAVALGLAALYPAPHPRLSGHAPIVAAADGARHPIGGAYLSLASDGAAVLKLSLDGSDTALSLPPEGQHREAHDGIETAVWVLARTSMPADAPSTLTLDRLVALCGGRIPVGLNPSRNPGPFSASWSTHRSANVWAVGGTLLDASERSTTIVTLSGGGLLTPRTVTVGNDGADALAANWQVAEAYRGQAIAELTSLAAANAERRFWAVQLPIMLAIVALLVAASASFTLVRLRRALLAVAANSIPKADRQIDSRTVKGRTHAAH